VDWGAAASSKYVCVCVYIIQICVWWQLSSSYNPLTSIHLYTGIYFYAATHLYAAVSSLYMCVCEYMYIFVFSGDRVIVTHCCV